MRTKWTTYSKDVKVAIIDGFFHDENGTTLKQAFPWLSGGCLMRMMLYLVAPEATFALYEVNTAKNNNNNNNNNNKEEEEVFEVVICAPSPNIRLLAKVMAC